MCVRPAIVNYAPTQWIIKVTENYHNVIFKQKNKIKIKKVNKVNYGKHVATILALILHSYLLCSLYNEALMYISLSKRQRLFC